MDPSHRRCAALSRHLTAGQRAGGGGINDIKRRLASWRSYLARLPDTVAAIQREHRPADPKQPWLTAKSFDAVVLGFGAAGAAAALTAADGGKHVLLVDRFEGGGSTRRSGGVVYAGGGTAAQRRAGVDDDADEMFKYLSVECQGCVSAEALRAFCDESAANFAWLEERVGVPFRDDGSSGRTVTYTAKTSYPPSSVQLYGSGNEFAAAFEDVARPALRGHRTAGDYLTGNILFERLASAVAAHPRIVVALHAPARALHFSDDGRCCGCTLRVLPSWDDVRGIHTMLNAIGSGSVMFDPSRGIDRGCASRAAELLKAFGTDVRVEARCGVVVATGGFFFDHAKVIKYAPKHSGGLMPLGNLGDDGSGLDMVLRDTAPYGGALLGQMSRVSAWKFINPPAPFVRGILVDAAGQRVGDESLYGATLADKLVQSPISKGRGWLLIDSEIHAAAMKDCVDPKSDLQEDQRQTGLANLYKNNCAASTWPELAAACKIEAPPGALDATVRRYNAAARQGHDGVFGKKRAYLRELATPPFYAINVSMVGSKYWPTPAMSLGGLEVHAKTGNVLSAGHRDRDAPHTSTSKTKRAKGAPIPGLYAAGRAAVGVASFRYISGLSIADALFSGRRAGRAIAAERGRVA